MLCESTGKTTVYFALLFAARNASLQTLKKSGGRGHFVHLPTLFPLPDVYRKELQLPWQSRGAYAQWYFLVFVYPSLCKVMKFRLPVGRRHNGKTK